ncbi:MAG: hypothetical protein LC723_12950 [Actinobacteria bacterium]|nr:hypothetical protein [Actinomycetota bacterium]
MLDQTRFTTIRDLLELHVEEDAAEDLGVLLNRFNALLGLVQKCISDGWDARDLRQIRGWLLYQEDGHTRLPHGQSVTIEKIDELLAEAAPAPPPVVAQTHWTPWGNPTPPTAYGNVEWFTHDPPQTNRITGIATNIIAHDEIAPFPQAGLAYDIETPAQAAPAADAPTDPQDPQQEEGRH